MYVYKSKVGRALKLIFHPAKTTYRHQFSFVFRAGSFLLPLLATHERPLVVVVCVCVCVCVCVVRLVGRHKSNDNEKKTKNSIAKTTKIMSNLLPDLASWALGGGAGNNGEGDEEPGGNQTASGGDGGDGNPLTEEEMRARRLARISALASPSSTQSMDVDSSNVASPTAKMSGANADKGNDRMDIDDDNNKERSGGNDNDKKIAAKPIAATKPAQVGGSVPATTAPLPTVSKPVAANTTTKSLSPPESSMAPSADTPAKKKRALDPTRKAQRKKELLVRKVLSISLTPTTDSSYVVVEVDDADVTPNTIAEILPTRLSTANLPMSQESGIISYLGGSYKKAAEELKNLRSSRNNKPSSGVEELLEEIKKQTVSYAASSLMVPDLFEGGKDGTTQLAKSLLLSSTNIAASIAHGVSGNASSFYYMLCEELISQDQTIFESVIQSVVKYLANALSKSETVLDGAGEGAEGGGLVVVSALTALCVHKKAAAAMTSMPNFLLPEEGTVQAQQRVEPPTPTPPPGATPQQQQFFRLMQAMRNNPGYLKRSGPGLEKETVLGLVLRLGCPRDSQTVTSAFPSTIASADSVEKAINMQRRQLAVYQGACNQLLRALVTAGAGPRTKVMQWFVDALKVNTGATAMRPDYSKVSKPATLINMSVVLLKLCEPFMDNESKSGLIHPGFVSSPSDHGGVYKTVGDDGVPRLAEIQANDTVEYNPKNKFVPQCFFFAARCLHLGYVPLSSFHHQLLRQISHTVWDLRQRNADLQSDPNFSQLVGMQRANEVTVYLEDLVSGTLRFCNLMGGFLLKLEGPELKRMPEHFVDDICNVLQFIAKMKPKMLSGHQFRNIFRMVVKLLSPAYADVSVLSRRILKTRNRMLGVVIECNKTRRDEWEGKETRRDSYIRSYLTEEFDEQATHDVPFSHCLCYYCSYRCSSHSSLHSSSGTTTSERDLVMYCTKFICRPTLTVAGRSRHRWRPIHSLVGKPISSLTRVHKKRWLRLCCCCTEKSNTPESTKR